MAWPEPPEYSVIVDPCAGEGEAVKTLREIWARRHFDLFREDDQSGGRPPRILACELEQDRAQKLRTNLEHRDDSYHGDAFRLDPEEGLPGATVLYLNPPYDLDPEYGRLEHKFLTRFTRHLHAGAGFLFFLVPYYALEASMGFLARHYLDLRAWRLPGPHFDAFKQVLVVGRRATRPLRSEVLDLVEFQDWYRAPGRLPVLPERCPDPLIVPGEMAYDQDYVLAERDLVAVFEGFRPFAERSAGLDKSAAELLGPSFPTAVPPKPVHTALALAGGAFNGVELVPNDPSRHPPILAKGVFKRRLHKVSERRDGEGELTATVEIERPELSLSILRLDEYTFHHLHPGTTPTGSDDPAEWNAADLISYYSFSLAANLERQFPALHEPTDAAARIELPALPRTPYRAQDHAIQASLKLLAQGLNPMIVAEVGTGKSTISLYVAAALSPEHHARTSEQLAALGLDRPLPVVRRTLIVAPPHLLKSWEDQAAAVVPEARVRIVREVSDLEADAEIYVLSRETAKLGHGIRGIEGQCPRCGATIPTEAKKNASRRLRCKATTIRPANAVGRWAERLAAFLAHLVPENRLVRDLVRGRTLERLMEREPSVPKRAARDLEGSLLGELERILRSRETTWRDGQLVPHLLVIVRLLANLNGTAARLRDRAQEMLDELPRTSNRSGFEMELRFMLRLLWTEIDEPLELADIQGRLLERLEKLHAIAEWDEGEPCGEPLFQATPEPRRFPLAKIIRRRYARRFSLLVLDEVHEFSHDSSAQTKAAHRLIDLPGVPTVALTGSLMGGYASSLFANFWALSPRFREEFERGEKSRFIDCYGFRKLLIDAKDDKKDKKGEQKPKRRGSHTDRDLDGGRNLGEAPGILPLFVLKHLLPTAVLVHKADLDVELPPMSEEPAPILFPEDDPLAGALHAEYRRLQATLLDRIKQERFDPERAGRLLGALVEMPSYLDRSTADLSPFEIRYPESLGGGLIARGEQFPEDWRTPKEAWLCERLDHHLGRGERVIVFLRHTGSAELPGRLLRLIHQHATPSALWLDTKKVPTKRREAWIDQHVLEPEIKVLLVNPNAVRTGLNNLVAFSTALWYELDYNAQTYRQANGRLHRIGQTRPVTIEFPFYAGTAQQIAFDLVARKVSASLQVDGLDIQAALEAAGASDQEESAIATALSLGQAVYEALTNGD